MWNGCKTATDLAFVRVTSHGHHNPRHIYSVTYNCYDNTHGNSIALKYGKCCVMMLEQHGHPESFVLHRGKEDQELQVTMANQGQPASAVWLCSVN